VGISHSATSTIESALKNVNPNAHWIARHLATAGGKRIKMRLLDTVVIEIDMRERTGEIRPIDSLLV
jgi:hypothetical protein